MRDLRAEDPAEVILAWEAVEEMLAVIPESPAKNVLRLMAAGLSADEIAERLGLTVADVEVLVARGRIRVLTAAAAHAADARASDDGSAHGRSPMITSPTSPPATSVIMEAWARTTWVVC